jgi:hypothetical protein
MSQRFETLLAGDLALFALLALLALFECQKCQKCQISLDTPKDLSCTPPKFRFSTPKPRSNGLALLALLDFFDFLEVQPEIMANRPAENHKYTPEQLLEQKGCMIEALAYSNTE